MGLATVVRAESGRVEVAFKSAGESRTYAADHAPLKRVRFRTLGCYPLTGAIESDATTLDDIVAEMKTAQVSERQGRLIDTDEAASMEKKKREGYF